MIIPIKHLFLFYFRSFNQRSVPGSVMFFNQCRKFQTFLWIRRYSQSQINPCRWSIGITGQLIGFVPVCRTWWRSWAFPWWWGQEKTCSSWYPQVTHCLGKICYVQKSGEHRPQWKLAQMNNQNPWGYFGGTSLTALPIQPILPIFMMNRLNWQCCLAGSSITAHRILIFF